MQSTWTNELQVTGGPGQSIATQRKTDAKQRERSFAGLPNHLYRWQEGMTAVPLEAESWRSLALGHSRPSTVRLAMPHTGQRGAQLGRWMQIV